MGCRKFHVARVYRPDGRPDTDLSMDHYQERNITMKHKCNVLRGFTLLADSGILCLWAGSAQHQRARGQAGQAGRQAAQVGRQTSQTGQKGQAMTDCQNGGSSSTSSTTTTTGSTTTTTGSSTVSGTIVQSLNARSAALQAQRSSAQQTD